MTLYNMFEKAWSLWNMRVAVLSSLCFQIVLIFLAPLRKRTRRIWINPIIWLCYLMADWIATYAIGVIVNHSRGSCDDNKGVDQDLAAFWAPFLLLHLGGPDTITAFSIEDNTLWMRHFLSMIIEVIVVLYVLFLAIPSNALLPPFLLIFVAGTIKYAERTRALYLACYGNINESWSESDRVEDTRHTSPVHDHMDVLLQAAYGLYKISRKLIYSHMFTKDEFEEGEEMMHRLGPEKAFNAVAVELSFIYDGLFTKMAAVHRGGWFSYFSRLICSAFILSAFVIFSTTKKLNIDIAITYALLVGAISLDFIAWIMLIFSNRTIAFLKDHSKASKVVHSIYRKMNCYNSGRCESISQHNFISYWMDAKYRQRTCFEKWFEATIEYFGLKTTYEELRYKYNTNVSLELKEFIHNYLKKLEPEDRELIIFSKGQTALSRYDHNEYRVKRLVECKYEDCLLGWHIATDLLYFTRDHSHGDDNVGDINHREICKVLSDHIFYLYIMRPSLISVHQGAFFQLKMKFIFELMRRVLHSEESSEERDVSDEALDREELSEQRDICDEALHREELSEKRNICKKIAAAEIPTSDFYSTLAYPHQSTTGDRDNIMWKVLSHVWMEMLVYGLYHSEGKAHAQQLGKGGEFITHVWLLMAHLGYNDCIQPEIGDLARELKNIK